MSEEFDRGLLNQLCNFVTTPEGLTVVTEVTKRLRELTDERNIARKQLGHLTFRLANLCEDSKAMGTVRVADIRSVLHRD
jgi:hypothetical protein